MDSSAADTRLQRGDVIQELDGKAVSNLSEFQRAIREAGKKPLLVLVNRGGNTQFLVISPR